MYGFLVWTCLMTLSAGAPSLVQLETSSSLSRVGRWNQWVFDKDNARLLLLFKGTPEGVKVWTNGRDLAVGPPDQQVQALPSLPLADAASLKRAARQEELAREEASRREELAHKEELRRQEELKHAHVKLPSIPTAPPLKETKQAVSEAPKKVVAVPAAQPPAAPQAAKAVPEAQVAPTPHAPAKSTPVAAQVVPHKPSTPVPEAPKKTEPVSAATPPAVVAPQPAKVVAVLKSGASGDALDLKESSAQGASQDHVPDPNVSPWTEVVYHAFKRDAGGDKAHLRKLLMEWLQHESDFNTRTWISGKVDQLEKRISLGLIATQQSSQRNAAFARNAARNGAHNKAHKRARNRAHSRARHRMVNRIGARARNGARGGDALSFSFGGQSAEEWARSLDEDNYTPPLKKPVAHHHGWHEMSKDRRKRMVEKLLQFAKSAKGVPEGRFLHPVQMEKKDVAQTVTRVLSAASALQKNATPNKPKMQVSLAQDAQAAAQAASAEQTQAVARAKAAAELAQKQAVEAAAAQKAQAQAAAAAAAQSAAAAEAARKAQAEAEAAAAAQKAQAQAAAAAAAQKAAEEAAAQRAQQAAAAAAAAKKAAEEAVAQQQQAEAAAAAAEKRAAAAAVSRRKMLYKQLKKLLKRGNEAWIKQAVQNAVSLTDARRKYNAFLLQAQMEAAKKFQLAASNSLTVKVSNDELRQLSFSGSLVGEEGIEGGDGPVVEQGSWHIALPQVKEETDAGTMTLAPDPDHMVFVMLGGGRYSAVLPLRPGAGRKLVATSWREVKESSDLETLPAGGIVAAPLKGVGQFWQTWKKKKAALAKKHAVGKSHKASVGAHHKTQQMTIVNPLAMAAPQAPSSSQPLQAQPAKVAAVLQQPVRMQPAQAQQIMPQAQQMMPQAAPVAGSATNPIDSAILAVAQSQTAQPTAAPVVQPPPRRPALVVAAPVARPSPPPVVQISPYSPPVSAVDDVITAAALSNSKLPSSWTSSVGHSQ